MTQLLDHQVFQENEEQPVEMVSVGHKGLQVHQALQVHLVPLGEVQVGTLTLKMGMMEYQVMELCGDPYLASQDRKVHLDLPVKKVNQVSVEISF